MSMKNSDLDCISIEEVDSGEEELDYGNDPIIEDINNNNDDPRPDWKKEIEEALHKTAAEKDARKRLD